LGIQDKAKHLATLFLKDLSDFIVECVDPILALADMQSDWGEVPIPSTKSMLLSKES